MVTFIIQLYHRLVDVMMETRTATIIVVVVVIIVIQSRTFS
jgi:hypothetical protein